MSKHDEVRSTREKLDYLMNRIEAHTNGLQFNMAETLYAEAEEIFEKLKLVVDPTIDTHRTIVFRYGLRLTDLLEKIENGLLRKEKGKKEDGNLAFKCNWNDRGYRGVCSDTAYDYNKSKLVPWCTYSSCRQYISFKEVPLDCCYESRALIDCSFGAGWDQDKCKGIRPRKIKSARKGKIALLTAIPPNTADRLVIGAFLMKDIDEDAGKETIILGDKDFMLDDMLRYNIKFWDFHKNPVNPKSTAWATGLFRYVSDVAVLGILEQYISRKESCCQDASIAKGLLQRLKVTKLD